MPKILVLQGPDAGKSFDIGRNAIVGREPRVHVVLTDPEVSDWHFQIFWKDGGFALKELFGWRTVTVNNEPLKEKSQLRHGSILKVGGTVLLFSEDETLDVPEELLEAESSALARNTAYRKKYTPTGTALDLITEAKETGDREAGVRRLLEFSQSVGAMDKEAGIFNAFLDFVFENFRADRATVLLHDATGNRFLIAARRQRFPVAGELRATASRAIVREVFRTRDYLLLEDAQEDRRFDMSASVSEQHIRAVMAVPMILKDKLLGVVVVDSTTHQGAFCKEDLNLLGALAVHCAAAVERVRMAEEVKEKLLLEKELSLAGAIQQRVLPRELPPRDDIEVWGTMIPARGVGGDYYDFVEKGDDLFIAVGDVAGKGVNAGLVMMMARTYFRSIVEVFNDPGDIVGRLNDNLRRDTAASYFMSFILAKWAPGKEGLLVCGAGHEHVLRFSKKAREVEAMLTGGMVLGVKSWEGAPPEVREIPFLPGDVILLYTDGVTEAKDAKGRMFELHRLTDALFRNAEKSLGDLVEDTLKEIRDFTRLAPQFDDITLVAARRKV